MGLMITIVAMAHHAAAFGPAPVASLGDRLTRAFVTYQPTPVTTVDAKTLGWASTAISRKQPWRLVAPGVSSRAGTSPLLAFGAWRGGVRPTHTAQHGVGRGV